jgi:hypothetical protein
MVPPNGRALARRIEDALDQKLLGGGERRQS